MEILPPRHRTYPQRRGVARPPIFASLPGFSYDRQTATAYAGPTFGQGTDCRFAKFFQLAARRWIYARLAQGHAGILTMFGQQGHALLLGRLVNPAPRRRRREAEISRAILPPCSPASSTACRPRGPSFLTARNTSSLALCAVAEATRFEKASMPSLTASLPNFFATYSGDFERSFACIIGQGNARLYQQHGKHEKNYGHPHDIYSLKMGYDRSNNTVYCKGRFQRLVDPRSVVVFWPLECRNASVPPSVALSRSRDLAASSWSLTLNPRGRSRLGTCRRAMRKWPTRIKPPEPFFRLHFRSP